MTVFDSCTHTDKVRSHLLLTLCKNKWTVKKCWRADHIPVWIPFSVVWIYVSQRIIFPRSAGCFIRIWHESSPLDPACKPHSVRSDLTCFLFVFCFFLPLTVTLPLFSIYALSLHLGVDTRPPPPPLFFLSKDGEYVTARVQPNGENVPPFLKVFSFCPAVQCFLLVCNGNQCHDTSFEWESVFDLNDQT